MLRRAVSGAVIAALLCGSLPVAAMGQDAAGITATAAYVPQDKDERGLWMRAEEEEYKLKTSNFVIRDPAINAYVRDVFCRTVGPECQSIRLYVVRTPYMNATSAPNGMIQLWSGMLLRTRNEAQLAAILAHEYVHYRDRHMLALWRQLKSKSGSATFFAMFGLIGALVALGELASIFSFSREQEAAADSASIEMMARAGYDPAEASKIWEQIRAEQDATAAARNTKSRKDKNGGMFGTHPPTAERMASLSGLAAKVAAGGDRKLNAVEYRTALGTMWPGFIDDQIKMNDFGATEYLLGYLGKEGWTPALNYARGELYRSRGRPADLTAAVGFYRESTASPDAPVEAWRGLGLSLLRSGSQQEGQAALTQYLTLRPDASDKSMIAMLAGGTK